MAKDQDSVAEEKKNVNLSKILPLLFVVLNLGVVGAGAGLGFMATIGNQQEKVTEDELIGDLELKLEQSVWHPIIYTLEPFTVNLDGYPKRTIHLEINLKMLDKHGFAEVIDLGPRTRDSIVRILTNKQYSELESIQGKLFLKEEISMKINEMLNEGVVQDVFFTKFNIAVL